MSDKSAMTTLSEERIVEIQAHLSAEATEGTTSYESLDDCMELVAEIDRLTTINGEMQHRLATLERELNPDRNPHPKPCGEAPCTFCWLQGVAACCTQEDHADSHRREDAPESGQKSPERKP